jgi:hypothetical protein
LNSLPSTPHSHFTVIIMPKIKYVIPSEQELFWFRVYLDDPETFERALEQFPSPSIQFIADALASMGDDQKDNNK